MLLVSPAVSSFLEAVVVAVSLLMVVGDVLFVSSLLVPLVSSLVVVVVVVGVQEAPSQMCHHCWTWCNMSSVVWVGVYCPPLPLYLCPD